MERITISSSLKHSEMIEQVTHDLDQIGIVALFPNLDSGVKKEDTDLELMKKLEGDHFEAINNSQALYVICPNGYVGTMVSVEIGYAKAIGKRIIFSEIPEDLGLQALADEYIPLEEIRRVKDL